MRKMRTTEIKRGLEINNWASICTVAPQNKPYAIEATYFYFDDEMGFMINPRGTTAMNVAKNPNVLLKVTISDKNIRRWAGISCFSKAFFETDKTAIQNGWALMGKVMNCDYTEVADRFCREGNPSPYLRVRIRQMTGRCSGSYNEEFLSEAN